MSKHGGSHVSTPNPNHVYAHGYRRLTKAEKATLREHFPGAKGHDYEASSTGEIFAKEPRSTGPKQRVHRPGHRALTHAEKKMMKKQMPSEDPDNYEVDSTGKVMEKQTSPSELDSIDAGKGMHDKSSHHSHHTYTPGRRRLNKAEKTQLKRRFPHAKGHDYEIDEAGETFHKAHPERPINLIQTSVSCLSCGGDADQQCTRCKRAFYCSVECKSADWEKKHYLECVATTPADVRINNRWTGLFRDHANNFINWVNALQIDCDPNTEAVKTQRDCMTKQLQLLKDQSDRRFSDSVVDKYSETLVKFATAALLHDASATIAQNSLIGGQINEIARVLGVLQQTVGISRSDYESAWQAHVQGLVDYTNAVKLAEPDLAEKAEETIQTSISAGQTFWGRKWKEESS